MRPGHFIRDSKASSCKQCSDKHNTLIHFNKPLSTKSTDNKKDNSKNSNAAVLCSHNQTNNTHVLLSTAIVLVKDKLGKVHKAHAILDLGSQSSLITNSLCEKLKLEKYKVHNNLEAVNNASCHIEHKCNISIMAQYNNYRFKLTCLIIPEITGPLPNNRINK